MVVTENESENSENLTSGICLFCVDITLFALRALEAQFAAANDLFVLNDVALGPVLASVVPGTHAVLATMLSVPGCRAGAMESIRPEEKEDIEVDPFLKPVFVSGRTVSCRDCRCRGFDRALPRTRCRHSPRSGSRSTLVQL